VSVGRTASSLVCCTIFAGLAAGVQQDLPPEKKPETFFAGIVTEYTPDKISVSRVVSGKSENRSFRVTKDTKVDGRLRPKVRVTVRYASDDDGDIATLIVVRTTQPKK
jgi:hypothetical protein